jgi:hypothetical protein
VISIFNTGPVGSAQVDPVFWGAISPALAGKIEALFLALMASFLNEPCAADFEDDATEGEACGKGFGGAEAYRAGLGSSPRADHIDIGGIITGGNT